VVIDAHLKYYDFFFWSFAAASDTIYPAKDNFF
jgi:hypothetical protein